LSRVISPSRPLSSPVFVFYFTLPLFRAVLEYPVWEGELSQENALAWVSPVGKIEMAVRLCDAENDAVVGFIASSLLQRHEIMCSPRPFISLPVFKNHVQVLAALCTTAVLPYISRLLCVVVELHPWALPLLRCSCPVPTSQVLGGEYITRPSDWKLTETARSPA